MRTIKKPKTMGVKKTGQVDKKFQNWAENRMKEWDDDSPEFYQELYSHYLKHGPKGYRTLDDKLPF
jgi:hypothetical protein